MDLVYILRISDRSKHIDVVYHYLRDSVEEEKLVVIHVLGEQNLADICNEGMPGPRFTYLNDNIMYSKL